MAALSVFSPNESLEDIGTRDLAYLFVPYTLSELYGRVGASEREERLQILDQGQVHADSLPSKHPLSTANAEAPCRLRVRLRELPHRIRNRPRTISTAGIYDTRRKAEKRSQN